MVSQLGMETGRVLVSSKYSCARPLESGSPVWLSPPETPSVHTPLSFSQSCVLAARPPTVGQHAQSLEGDREEGKERKAFRMVQGLWRCEAES